MPLSPPAKGVLWLICGLILLILAVPGTWLLVNVYDAPLDPQVLAVLERKYDTIAPAENLFYALLALNSQDAGDINAQGQRLYKSARIDLTMTAPSLGSRSRAISSCFAVRPSRRSTASSVRVAPARNSSSYWRRTACCWIATGVCNTIAICKIRCTSRSIR
jgi:hypothetical protein